jgi:hypothetical protein
MSACRKVTAFVQTLARSHQLHERNEKNHGGQNGQQGRGQAQQFIPVHQVLQVLAYPLRARMITVQP